MHLQRVLSGLLLFPAAIACILWSPPRVFAAVVCLLALAAAGEVYALASAWGVRPVWPTGLAAAALAALAPSLGGAGVALGALALAGAGTLAWLALAGGDPSGALARAGVTTLGAAYVGGLLAFALLLRQGPAGPARVLAAALITWAGDIAAFYAGRTFGRRRLAPRVSPGKTVEGAVAGLLASALAGAAGGPWFWPGHLLLGAGAGALVGLAGQVGDLAESLLKRSLGAKDSGRLIPGHGGVLDRIDSLLFALPALYGLARLGLVP
jgi:phosphatidate cytidylyltransferase